MPLNFPSQPNLNDTYTSGSVTWRWNGYAWDVDTSDDVYATTFHGALDGNANTASALLTARLINGVAFNGTQNITVPAAANTLTGTTINSPVVNSSLTSVGTLNVLTVSGDVTANSNVVIDQNPTQQTHATNKRYVDARAIAMYIGLS